MNTQPLRARFIIALSLAIAGCAGNIGDDGNETVESDLRTATLTARRADASPVSLSDGHQGSEAVLLEDPVLQEDALLVEQHEAFESVTVRSDRLELRFAGESPLAEGMVVGGGASGGYLRRIERIERDGDRVVAYTSRAEIGDLFAELELAIAYRPRTQRTASRAPSSSVGRRTAGLGDGSCHDVSPCQASGSADVGALRRAATRGARSVSCDFGADGSLEVDADLAVDFDADIEVSLRRKNFFIHTRGDANAFVQINGEGSVTGDCDADFAEAIFADTHWTLLRFSVLGIPGQVYAYPVIRGDIRTSAEGSFEARVEVTAFDERTLGWRRGDWTNEVNRGFEFERSAQAEASVNASATLDVGIGLGVSLGADLVIVAAQAGIEGALFGRVEANYEASASYSSETGVLECPWSFDASAALMAEGRAYASFGIWPFIWRGQEEWGPSVVVDFGALADSSGDYCEGGDRCLPASCESLGCGRHDDGCGGTVDCGACDDDPSCEPATCEDVGLACGGARDGCGGWVDCGSCVPHVEACEDIGEGWCPDDQDCSFDGRCVSGLPIFR